jgi:DNA-binding NarL/FixJ family response regulator
MRDTELNISIVDSNKLVVNGLKYYLQNRYGQCIRVFSFSNLKTFIDKLDRRIESDIIIMDTHTYNNDEKAVKLIKSIQPKAEIIPLSNNETVALMLESFKESVKDAKPNQSGTNGN